MSRFMAQQSPNAVNGTGAEGDLSFTDFANIIDGQLSLTTQTRHGINPANEEINPEVPVSTQEDVDRAVAAGKRAFRSWADTSYAERRNTLLAFAQGLENNKDGFAELLIKEQGKPAHSANFEMDFAINMIRIVANLELPTQEVVNDDKRQVVVRYTPLGLAVGIVPWNFPVLLCCSKIAPCVVTGNPIIIKPSPFTPYSGLKVVELAQRYFPPGVIQALSGDDNLGPWLTAHPGPAKISFTGSTQTGKKVMEAASKTLKRVTLELGGNDPAIICDDVNIEEVAPKVAELAFLNSSQICLALKRIYIHEKIFTKFRDAMVSHTKDLRLGHGHQQGVFLGPVQNSAQYQRIKGFFDEIDTARYDVAVGGKNPNGPGYFITPTIIDRPKDDARIVVEEPFGPIVPLLSFTTDDEAVIRANDTNYGLGASVWSSDVARATKIAHKLEAGTVWVNTHFEIDPRAPLGGHKESGIGLEFGVGGLQSYCNSQTLYLPR